MPEKKQSEKKKIAYRVILAVCVILFYLSVFLISDDETGKSGVNTVIESYFYEDIVVFLFLAVWITGTVFTVKLAKELNRSTVGYGIGTFFTIMISSAVLLFLKNKPGTVTNAELEEKTRQDSENKILAAAKKNNGILTIGEAALETGLSLDKVSGILDDLVKKDYASLEHTEHGTLQYCFPEFYHGNE
jgi:hypothetical protein